MVALVAIASDGGFLEGPDHPPVLEADAVEDARAEVAATEPVAVLRRIGEDQL